jgi:hypothetical protein
VASKSATLWLWRAWRDSNLLPRLRRGQLAEREPRSFVALVREFRKLWGDFACWRTDSNYVITIIWRARVMSGVVMANAERSVYS